MEFTEEQQAHIDNLIQAEQAKIAELESQIEGLKPKELTNEQKEIQKLKADLLQQNVVSQLKSMDMEDFIDFITVNSQDELQPKLDKLNEIISNRKLDNSYVPEGHKKQTAYDKAEQAKDTVGMIGSKLSKIFG
jgi:hypothetical protein